MKSGIVQSRNSDVNGGIQLIGMITRAFLCLLIIASPSTRCSQAQDREGSAEISGKVTVDGKPAADVTLVLSRTRTNERREERMMQGANVTRTVTDSAGRYRFSKLAEGNYAVSTFAPSLIADAGAKVSNSIAVAEGEEVDGMDFDLKSAVVITGTVTSSDARPVIGLGVNAMPYNQPGDQSTNTATFGSARTDDRGVYRIFGLTPGRYRVEATGGNIRGITTSPGVGAGSYRDHDDPSKPGIVILAHGAEASGIDIRLDPPEPRFEASGRVVDQSGDPVPDINVVCAGEDREMSFLLGAGSMGQPTNALGEFKVRGLKSGNYEVATFMLFASDNEYYGETLKFEVKGSNVTGLELKVQKGMTVSGQVVLEGSDDPQVLARMYQYQILAATDGESPESFSLSKSAIGPGGEFTLHGLAPGKLHIVFGDVMQQQSSFQISRAELNGVPQRDALQINAGQDLVGLKVVVSYANCSIHGHVAVAGGKLPKGASLFVSVTKSVSDSSASSGMIEGDGRKAGGSAYVDPGGDFKVQGLAPGEYQVTVQIMSPDGGLGSANKGRSAQQTITLTGGQDAEIEMTLDLAAPAPGDKSTNTPDRDSSTDISGGFAAGCVVSLRLTGSAPDNNSPAATPKA